MPSEKLRAIIARGSPDLPGEVASPPEDMVIFTPQTDDTGVRIVLFVEKSPNMPRRPGATATIIDLPTGIEFDVESAPCCLPTCHCAARVRAIHLPA